MRFPFPIRVLLRDVGKPSWLGEDERMQIDDDPHMSEETDEWILRGHVIGGMGADAPYRAAEARISGRALAAVKYDKEAVVDLIWETIEELVAKLEPDPLPDDLMQLAMAAFGDAAALDVFMDALLERGAIKPYKIRLGRRVDVRTDEEKRRHERSDLARKALDWATPHIEILFRRHWSVKPWRVKPLVQLIMRDIDSHEESARRHFRRFMYGSGPGGDGS